MKNKKGSIPMVRYVASLLHPFLNLDPFKKTTKKQKQIIINKFYQIY